MQGKTTRAGNEVGGRGRGEGDVLARPGGARRDGRQPGLKLRAVSPHLTSPCFFLTCYRIFPCLFRLIRELWGTSFSSVGEGKGRVGKSGVEIIKVMQEVQRNG